MGDNLAKAYLLKKYTGCKTSSFPINKTNNTNLITIQIKIPQRTNNPNQILNFWILSAFTFSYQRNIRGGGFELEIQILTARNTNPTTNSS